MEIIISANEKILAMTQNEKKRLFKNMNEQEYMKWIHEMTEEVVNGEDGIQKKSQFNYVSNTKSGHLIYNTLYNSLTRLTDKEYTLYITGNVEDEQTLNQFISQGIVVDSSTDELEQYNLYVKYASLYVKQKPHITVTPTMECNASCFYCYEDGVRCGRMDKTDCSYIIRFLKTLDCSQGIDVTWFGGEPLMNQEWMDTFSESLEKEGIDFSAFIITNGSKITDEVIERMVTKWRIDDIQITLDGCFEEYALRKNYMDCDGNIYYRILRIIGKLANAGISVQVRMNADRNNMDSILQAVEDISNLYGDNSLINCYPAFLSGTEYPLSDREKIEFIKRMIEISNGKFNVNKYLYRLPRTMACYYNQANAFSVDTKGDIFICEHLLGHEECSLGNIKSEVKIEQREISGRRIECQKCVFLPKCQGGCIDALKHGEIPCFTDKYIIKAYLEMI